jgi:hypothetical protein
MGHIVSTCKKHNVPVGHPHVTSANVEHVLEEGFRFIMSAPVCKYDAIDKVRGVNRSQLTAGLPTAGSVFNCMLDLARWQ